MMFHGGMAPPHYPNEFPLGSSWLVPFTLGSSILVPGSWEVCSLSIGCIGEGAGQVTLVNRSHEQHSQFVVVHQPEVQQVVQVSRLFVDGFSQRYVHDFLPESLQRQAHRPRLAESEPNNC